ncbi:MAG TPA: hypothetical protein VLA90_03330 [Actinomycetota bacterium]|nr:hypothetical protein [Actinomycetota bacterium]
MAVSSTGLTQVALALGAVGALSIAAGAIGFLIGWVDPAGRARERVFTVIGAALLLAGSAVQLYAVGR